jgi:hypothetical protein
MKHSDVRVRGSVGTPKYRLVQVQVPAGIDVSEFVLQQFKDAKVEANKVRPLSLFYFLIAVFASKLILLYQLRSLRRFGAISRFYQT